MDTKAVDSNVPTVAITLKCRPGGYGDLVTGPSQTTAGPVVQLTVPDVPGDMPTDEAYIVVTDQSSQSRRHVEWGAEWLHYNASTALILDSDSLVTSGYAGTQATFGCRRTRMTRTRGDRHHSRDPYASAWTAMLSTGSHAHVGTFRVKARVMGSAGRRVLPVLLAGRGRRPDRQRLRRTRTGPSANDNFREIDLGLITIPPATAGTQSWDGHPEVQVPATVYHDGPWSCRLSRSDPG